ncbi:ligase-associated DNA damage response endonuclease PdeM [Roseibacterium beibuensis]|uniref:Ligase-associated DNA damage response endonuclease PdeM n=1 Tax=[Roseibacterium] beibuensis TaxID=1193142 RepID=A0ABP9KSS5_9RHOB|nr:ligase-associated DNA damage response endonuclease PdeM [Roseibacterium beibuensis]MCS6622301.1 ligase-associated DNA damage response endonuclease PdeM [Roseibacterium beibuensis]
MNTLPFTFAGETFHARPSGALSWPAQGLLCVSDLHLGKSERMARRGGPMLPPYEGMETLAKLAEDIAATDPKTVICLGDSFDDSAAAEALDEETSEALGPLMAGRRWIWIEGNHDPGPVSVGGTHLATVTLAGITFRHIADPEKTREISGHYHPKARVALRGRSLSRRCFLVDDRRLVLPAYGTYTGGLSCDRPELSGLMAPGARAILLGDPPVALPMPRARRDAG